MSLSFYLSNLFTAPILSLIFGFFLSFYQKNPLEKIKTLITSSVLFLIGFKGGIAIAQNEEKTLLTMIFCLAGWGFLQPFLSSFILKKITKLDSATIATIAACFGSVSVMTYVAGVHFLERLGISYDGYVMVALAIMEAPAIISGLWIAKKESSSKTSFQKILFESILNPTLLILFLGMILGFFSKVYEWQRLSSLLFLGFKPLLALFLCHMGILIGKNRREFKQFSSSLIGFGILMPLVSAFFGIYLSYLFQLEIGTATLVALLTASASYIAVPAAMKEALPQAKEAIYLPLSLGITFPFNLIIGIPLYHEIAKRILTLSF